MPFLVVRRRKYEEIWWGMDKAKTRYTSRLS